MGQTYNSFAVDAQNEVEPFRPSQWDMESPQQHYEPGTYPGRRLPHVWLGEKIAGPLVSTLDIAGKGRFTLFTRIGGESWKEANQSIKNDMAVDIDVFGIGYGLEWEDRYPEWMVNASGVEEDGCVLLVRPDYFVAWRAEGSGREVERLGKATKKILGPAG